MLKRVGDMLVTSGHVVVTDPTYSLGTWCSEQVDVLNGKYQVYIDSGMLKEWGERVKSIMICHDDYKWQNVDFTHYSDQIGVDSATCGIFDIEWFESLRHTLMGPRGEEYKLYQKGAMCWSGLGDGRYDMYAASIDDKIIAIKVVFIYDEDLE